MWPWEAYRPPPCCSVSVGRGAPQSQPGDTPVTAGDTPVPARVVPQPEPGVPQSQLGGTPSTLGYPQKGSGTRDQGKNLGLGTPCEQTDWRLWKYYLPVVVVWGILSTRVRYLKRLDGGDTIWMIRKYTLLQKVFFNFCWSRQFRCRFHPFTLKLAQWEYV